MIGRIRLLVGGALSLALAVPLAAPSGLPGSAGSMIASGGALEAATPRRPRAIHPSSTVRRAATRRVCSVVKVRGRNVRRCRTVAIAAPVAAPPVIVQPVVETPPLAPPPAPRVQPAPIPPQAYVWIDQADSLARAIGDAPPDFAFQFDGVDCWAWVSRTGETLIVEPGRGGVVQYYFNTRATAPYLVRDSYYSYGYDGPDLMQVYTSEGRVWRDALSRRQSEDSDQLQARGRAILSASWRQQQWDRAAAQAWDRQAYDRGFGAGYGAGWFSGWQADWRDRPDWQGFSYSHSRQRPPRRLDDEHRARREAHDRFEAWRRAGGQGNPPAAGLTSPPIVPPPSPSTSYGGEQTAPVTPPRPRGPRPEQQPPALSAPPAVIDSPPAPAPVEPERRMPRRDIAPIGAEPDPGSAVVAEETRQRERARLQAEAAARDAAIAAQQAAQAASEESQAAAARAEAQAAAQRWQQETEAASARAQAEANAAAARAQAQAAAQVADYVSPPPPPPPPPPPQVQPDPAPAPVDRSEVREMRNREDQSAIP